jgi:tetratricopeptide (TPR) repeat protein
VPINRFIAPAALILVASLAADVRGQDASVLARTGTAAIDEHRFGEALAAFTEASAMRPNDTGLSFGAGVAAFMLGQNEVARFSFERALALNPGYAPAALWLADLHYRAGRLEEAISTCQAALLRTPRDRQLRQRLVDWRKEQQLQSRFREIRTDHFIVLFEAVGDEPLARHVLERLEAAYSRIGNALRVYPSQPITALIYSRQQFDDITGLAAWSTGGYDGRIRLPRSVALDDRDEVDRVLSHEFVHALIDMLGGRIVPAWMNEGLATALEPVDPAAVDPAARTTERAALLRLHRGFVALSRRDAEVAYASAAQAVRRLIDQRGVTAVVALLEDLGRGAPFASAFERRIGMRYEDFAAGDNP